MRLSMAKKWRLTDRTRTLLTLELAICLPAAALMALSMWNLKHLQRDKSIEAAIQRDFQYVLRIAERKSWDRATDILLSAQKEFPNPEDNGSQIKVKLENILLEHPEFAYVAFYDKEHNLFLSQAQPSREQDPEFCARTEETINMVAKWLPVEAADLAGHLRAGAEKEHRAFKFWGGWTPSPPRRY